MRVIETDPYRDSRWLEFVATHPDGTVYHHPAWLQALQREYGQTGVHLACVDGDGRFLAILPLAYTRGLPFRLGGLLTARRLSSLPRTPLAGPLSIARHATVSILRAAMSRVREKPGIEFQIKTQGPELDGLFADLVCIPWRMSYRLALPPPSDLPFRIANNHERARIKWAINKATKLGVYVRPAETATDINEWYTLYLETMRRNVVPPRPRRFFSALWELLRAQGMMELLIAEQHSGGRRRILAGSIFLRFGRTVSYAFNGSRLADLSLRPNDVIQWRAINDAYMKGVKYFDFGEVPAERCDLAKFKSKWGAQPMRLYRYYLKGASVADDSHKLCDIVRVSAEAVWQHLPLKATAWVGDHFYGYL